jgi:hypothetical protein
VQTAEKHFLVTALEQAETDSAKDYHLSMMSDSYYTSFFKKEENKNSWQARLNTMKTVDLQRSPLFEAISLFGESKIEKNYKKGISSAEKFEQMEKLSIEKNWLWLFVYSIETAAYIYKTYNQVDRLRLISSRVATYLQTKKEIVPIITVLRLVQLFKNLLLCSEKTDIQKVCEIAVDFSERTVSNDPFNFQRSFLLEALEFARFMKNDADVGKFQNRIIEKWVEEANLKGKGSNLVKFSLLQSALDFSTRFGNKEKTEEIKLMLSKTDFDSELKEISLPKEQAEKLEKETKEYLEKLRGSIRKYIAELSKLDTTSILMNIASDNSIIRLNVAETEKFVKELLEKHPLQNIFRTLVDTGQKVIQVEPGDDKVKSQLNEQLLIGLRETIWFVNEITRELEERSLFSSSMVGEFLSRCSCIDNNIFEIVDFGLFHHFNEDYVASISILVPMIEATLLSYLKAIGADVSSYEGKVLQNRDLGGLINQKEVETNFGKDFQYFMKLFFTEGDSINFRNRLAHGAVGIKEFNKQVSTTILFVLVKIAAKTIK